jgi:hypothetical protein
VAIERRAKLLWSGSSYVAQRPPTDNEIPIAVVTVDGDEIIIHADARMTPWAKRWIEQIASPRTAYAAEPVDAVYARIGGPPLGMEPINFNDSKSASRYDRFTAKLGKPVGRARQADPAEVRRIAQQSPRLGDMPTPSEARKLLADRSPRKRQAR